MNPTLDYTKTGDPTKDAVNKKRAENVAAGLDPSANGATISPATPAAQNPAVITPADLAQETPVNITEASDAFNDSSAKVSAGAASITGATDAKITTAYNDLQNLLKQQQESAASSVEASRNKLLEQIGVQTDALSEATTARQTPEFLAKQKAANDAYSKLQQSKMAEANEIDVINKSNMTDAGRAAALNDVRNRYALANANLAVTYDIENRDYLSAQENINTIAKLKMDAVQPWINYYTTALTNDTMKWTKSEENVLNQKIYDLKTQQDNAKDVADVFATLLQNNPDAITPLVAQGLNQQADKASALAYLAKNGISLENQLDRQYKLAQINKLNAEAKDNGTVSLTRYDANGNPIPPGAKEKALQVILGSGKFTKDQKNAVINAINNGEDPVTVIKNQAKNLMGTEAGKVTNYEIAQQAMSDIDSALDQYYANGGSTNIFSGSFEKTLNKLGEVDDPELVELATQIASSLQVYRNAVSGTAYSVQEGKEIANVFPGINKSQGLNDAIISGRMKAFDSTINGAYRTVLGSSYDELTKEESRINTEQAGGVNDTAMDASVSGSTDETVAPSDSFWSRASNWLFGE